MLSDLLPYRMQESDALPHTRDVLAVIFRHKAVMVGSWPVKKKLAKDIDFVVPGRGPEDQQHPLFAELRERFPTAFQSTVIGHVYIDASPQPVEFFESKIPSLFAEMNEVKKAGVLSYRQASQRSVWIEAYQVKVRAVMPGTMVHRH